MEYSDIVGMGIRESGMDDKNKWGARDTWREEGEGTTLIGRATVADFNLRQRSRLTPELPPCHHTNLTTNQMLPFPFPTPLKKMTSRDVLCVGSPISMLPVCSF